MAVKKKKAVKKKGLKRKAVAGNKPAKRTLPKKAAVRKTATRKAVKKRPAASGKTKKNIIGLVTHYFPKVRAAVIKLKAPLSLGETIRIKGHTTDFTQTITSMQIDRVPINSAKKGDEIGLLVNSRVRSNDIVSKPQVR
jgi:hypothetical protein